jgi:hypothetical protein
MSAYSSSFTDAKRPVVCAAVAILADKNIAERIPRFADPAPPRSQLVNAMRVIHTLR